MNGLEFNQENWDLLLDRVQYLKTEVQKYKYDFLTALRMRKDFDGYLTTLFEMYEFERRLFTMILIDINDLHTVNRVHGYAAGDNLILKIANVLSKAFVECNGTEVFRIGGDEFTVLLKGYNQVKLDEILSGIEGVTYAYTVCDPNSDIEYASPAHVFRVTDNKVIEKKKERKTVRL